MDNGALVLVLILITCNVNQQYSCNTFYFSNTRTFLLLTRTTLNCCTCTKWFQTFENKLFLNYVRQCLHTFTSNAILRNCTSSSCNTFAYSIYIISSTNVHNSFCGCRLIHFHKSQNRSSSLRTSPISYIYMYIFFLSVMNMYGTETKK